VNVSSAIEHPILFSGPMVRAILEGRKTQTRRLVTDHTSQGNHRASELLLDSAWVDPGPSPVGNPGPYLKAPPNTAALANRYGGVAEDYAADVTERLYPRVFVGDRFWVREAFCLETNASCDLALDAQPPFDDGRPVRWFSEEEGGAVFWSQPHYRATDPEPELCYDGDRPSCRRCEDGEPHAHWRPSIHMPRWASRINLEVTRVRAQRLQEVSEQDAAAEGVGQAMWSAVVFGRLAPLMSPNCYRAGFAAAWGEINGDRATWESNPWVWVFDFDLVEAHR